MKNKSNSLLMNLKLFLTLLLALLGSGMYAQAPDWAWAKSAGGNNTNVEQRIATDANGNVLVTGVFNSPTITFGTVTLTTGSFFIVKYDASGNVLWAKSAGEQSQCYSRSIATDANGNVLVIGHFTSPTITFGTTTLINTNAFSDIFIVKYDANGNVLWAKSASGKTQDTGIGITTDANGNILVTGGFTSYTITFGITTLSNADTSLGGADIFIVKYDTNGNVLWAKSAGGNYSEFGTSVATDANGNVLVTGFFSSDTITFGIDTLTNAGANDIFVVKYNASGNMLWAKSAGGIEAENSGTIATDINANVLLTGSFFSQTITFGTITLTNVGGFDIFIVKYDASGNVLWAKSAGGIFQDYGVGIASNVDGDVLLTGSFANPAITFGTTTLTNAGNNYDYDIFIVKYDASGNELWAKSAGGIGNDYSYGIATDANGNVLVTGEFKNPTITFGATTLTNNGVADLYVAKLSSITGIAELNNNAQGLHIYPNPTKNMFTLEVSTELKNASIEMYNAFGQKVYASKLVGRKQLVNCTSFASGVYEVKVFDEAGLYSNKLIIE